MLFFLSAEIKDVVGLHAWALDDGETVASFVLTTDVNDLHRLVIVADEVRAELEHALGIVHATIEWRPLDARVGCAKPCPSRSMTQTLPNSCPMFSCPRE